MENQHLEHKEGPVARKLKIKQPNFLQICTYRQQ